MVDHVAKHRPFGKRILPTAKSADRATAHCLWFSARFDLGRHAQFVRHSTRSTGFCLHFLHTWLRWTFTSSAEAHLEPDLLVEIAGYDQAQDFVPGVSESNRARSSSVSVVLAIGTVESRIPPDSVEQLLLVDRLGQELYRPISSPAPRSEYRRGTDKDHRSNPSSPSVCWKSNLLRPGSLTSRMMQPARIRALAAQIPGRSCKSGHQAQLSGEDPKSLPHRNVVVDNEYDRLRFGHLRFLEASDCHDRTSTNQFVIVSLPAKQAR